MFFFLFSPQGNEEQLGSTIFYKEKIMTLTLSREHGVEEETVLIIYYLLDIFQAKLPNILFFQLLKCEDFLI